MKAKLLTLPDAKFVVEKHLLTVDNIYEISGYLGNCYVLKADDGKMDVAVLQSRFQEVPD